MRSAGTGIARLARRFRLAALGGCALVSLAAACTPSATPDRAGPNPNCRSLACSFTHLTLVSGFRSTNFNVDLQPVGIAAASGDYVITNNYKDLYRIHGRSLERLAVPDSIRMVPAAVFVSGQLLYVANDWAHNVLVFAYPAMTLARTITDGLIGPEGVYADTSGFVDVADYDGSSVSRYAPDGRRLWTQPVPEAHGVTEFAGAVYVTSLAERSIERLNRETGAVESRSGSEGTNPGQFLWPTGITTSRDELLVVDAHTGRVTRLSAALDLRGVVGVGNGPGTDLFNFPYSLLVEPAGYVVVDTLKARLLTLDHAWRATSEITFSSHPPGGRGLTPLVPPVRHPYTTAFATEPLDDVLGLSPEGDSVEGYNSIDEVRAGEPVREMEMTNPIGAEEPQLAAPFLYWTWSRSDSRFTVVGSPEQVLALVIDRTTGRFGYSRIPLDVWALPDHALRRADGSTLSVDAIASGADFGAFDTRARLEALVTSAAGERYAHSGDVNEYLEATSSAYYVNVPEVLAVRRLAALTAQTAAASTLAARG